MAGRKSKYTPEVVKRITDALTAGMSHRGASAYGGIDEDTFIRWVNRYADFADSVIRAESQCEFRAALTIRQAFNDGDWKAAAFWLERRRNADWGQQAKIEIINSVREMARASGADEDAAVAEAVEYLREMQRARRSS